MINQFYAVVYDSDHHHHHQHHTQKVLMTTDMKEGTKTLLLILCVVNLIIGLAVCRGLSLRERQLVMRFVYILHRPTGPWAETGNVTMGGSRSSLGLRMTGFR